MKKSNFLWKYKYLIFICFICIVLELLMDLLMPIILSDTINNGIGNINLNYIIKNVLIMSFILLIGIFGSIIGTYLSSKISSDIGYDLRKKLMEKICNLRNADIDSLNIGNLSTLITNDVGTLENIIFLTLKILIKIPIILIGSVLMCLTLSSELSFTLLIVIPIIVIISLIIMKKSYPYFNLTNETLDEINFKIRENVGNIKFIKANNKEDYEVKKFNKINKKLKMIDTQAMKILSYLLPIVIFIINITVIIILWYGKIEINKGNFKIGDITAFIEYINLLLTSIVSLFMVLLMAIQGRVSIVRIKNILKMKNEEIDGLEFKINGDIEFKNVYFSYNNDNYILKDINLKISKGEKIAIVGKSGSGKSTLVNLLNKNYLINKGQILIDNIDLNEIDTEYMRIISLVINQKSNLFKGSIKDNLTLGKNKDIDKEINITLSDKIINKKENKLNYMIEQNGKNLSGGERQRLVLCRSLIKNPNILILDDSLSALDLKSEQKIIKNLLNNYNNKTIIVVTNRISSIKDFDKIILLNDGRIKKIGNHKELLSDSIYASLYNKKEVL